jgi:hypothetical protein
VFQLRVNLGASHLLDLSRSTIGPPILDAEALGAPEGSDSLVWSRAVSAVTERSEAAAAAINPEDPGSAAEPGEPAS